MSRKILLEIYIFDRHSLILTNSSLVEEAPVQRRRVRAVPLSEQFFNRLTISWTRVDLTLDSAKAVSFWMSRFGQVGFS